MMRTLSALTLLAVFAAGFAFQRGTMTARTPKPASLGEAMERVYTREIASVEAEPPGTLEEICRAALSWRFPEKEPPKPKRRPGARGGNGPLDISLGKLSSKDGRATAIVTKKYDGLFYRRWDRASKVKSAATFRHTWMSDGSKWLLVTSELLNAHMTLDGKGFTPDKKYWNPNTSFRAGTPLDPSGRESGLP